MNTFKTLAASVALSLSLVLASSAAFAGEKGAGKMAFPVAAATYKQHVDARLEKKKTKLEARIANKKIPADKADQMRAKFAERKAKVQAAVEKAVADGTVTKEEAKEVRKAGGGHGHKGKKGKPALRQSGMRPIENDTDHASDRSVSVSLGDSASRKSGSAVRSQ